jgi:hypothetical protein
VDITPYPNQGDHDTTTPPYPIVEQDKDSHIQSNPLPGEKLPWRTETPAGRVDEPTVMLNEKQDSGSIQGSDIESSHVSSPDGSKMQIGDVTPSGVAANAQNSAFKVAQEGGRHAGQLKQFLKQDATQLGRSIRKFEKNIANHEKWIADPKSKIPEWNTFSAERQANTIHHWQQDIARAQELQSIANEVVKQKGF